MNIQDGRTVGFAEFELPVSDIQKLHIDRILEFYFKGAFLAVMQELKIEVKNK